MDRDAHRHACRGTLEILITLPFFVPGLLEAIGWIMLLSPNTGTINVWIRSLFGTDGTPFNIYSMGGMIWVMSLGSTSFIFLLLVNALRNMDAALEESARSSGAGAVRVALTITLPLMAPVILGAGMLSFIRAMDAFEVPVLLGLPAKVFVFSNRIYAAVQYDYPVNYGLATALGVSFFVLMIALLWMQAKVLGQRSFFVVTGKGYTPRIVRLGRFKYVTLAVCLLYFRSPRRLPLSQVLIGSFQRVFACRASTGSRSGNYGAILSDLTLWRGLINTFVVCGFARRSTVLLCTHGRVHQRAHDYVAEGRWTWSPGCRGPSRASSLGWACCGRTSRCPSRCTARCRLLVHRAFSPPACRSACG